MGLLHHWLGVGPWRGEAGHGDRLLPPSQRLCLGLYQVQPGGLQRRKQYGHGDSGQAETSWQNQQGPDFRARLGGLCESSGDWCDNQAPGSPVHGRRLPLEPDVHPTCRPTGPRVLQRAVQSTCSAALWSWRPVRQARQDLDWGQSLRLQRSKPELLWRLVPHRSWQVNCCEGWQRASPCVCHYRAGQRYHQVRGDQDLVRLQPGRVHGGGAVCDGGSRLVPLHGQPRDEGAARGPMSSGAPPLPRTSRQQAGTRLLETPPHRTTWRTEPRDTWLRSTGGKSHQAAVQGVRAGETGQEEAARVTILLSVVLSTTSSILVPLPSQRLSFFPATLVTGTQPVKIHSERNHQRRPRCEKSSCVCYSSPMSDKSFVHSKVIKDCIYAQFYVLHIWRHFKSCSYSYLVHPT